jgi:hypothetical protein
MDNVSAVFGFYSDVTASEPPGSHCNWRAKSRIGVVFGLYLDVSYREPLEGHCNRRDISRRWDCIWMMALPYSAFTRMSRRVNRPEVIVTEGIKVAPVSYSAYTWMSRTENRSKVIVTEEI